jgi:hypothetical protein
MYANINAGLSALAPETFPGAPVAVAPDRAEQIRQAYSGIAARPAGEVSDIERFQVAQRGGFRPEEIASTFNMGYGNVNRMLSRGQMLNPYASMLQKQQDAMAQQEALLNPPAPQRFMNMGGIAALAQGGYPRRNGQISGPGTEKSDSIPAMLSDGEFVMTAKAVRGAGKGSRRAGAKQMYKLMHQLEKNSERG